MHKDREKNIHKHNYPFQTQTSPKEPTKANFMRHQRIYNENPNIVKEFWFYYSHLHL